LKDQAHLIPKRPEQNTNNEERYKYKTVERQKNRKAIEDIENILVSIKNTLGKEGK